MQIITLLCQSRHIPLLAAFSWRRLNLDRLFVYGSLAPNRANHHVISHVQGTWQPATVKGKLHDQGWGGGTWLSGNWALWISRKCRGLGALLRSISSKLAVARWVWRHRIPARRSFCFTRKWGKCARICVRTKSLSCCNWIRLAKGNHVFFVL